MVNTIQVTWSIEDIRSLGYTCTDEQGSKVLSDVLKYHDANVGINWDVISFHCDNHDLVQVEAN